MATKTIIVQLDSPKNQTICFDPLQAMFFGGYKQAGLPPGASSRQGDAREYPDIPGRRIVLDVDGRFGEIQDPLGDEANRDLLAQVNQIRRKHGKHDIAPTSTERHEDMQPTNIATWLWHMSKHVDVGEARVLQGDLKGMLAKQDKSLILTDCFTGLKGEPRYLNEVEAQERWGIRWHEKLYGEPAEVPGG
jgi:hypothetical protein